MLMMSNELSNDLVSLFHAQIEEINGDPVLRIPASEIRVGPLTPGDTVQVALNAVTVEEATQSTTAMEFDDLPVSQGEEYDLEIESVGDQGDGIARTDEGFVVIVPDTRPGERVRVEITDVSDSVAFAEVVERYDQLE